MTFRLIQGDNRDVLKTIEDNSIDAIVTDPPYGIDFLGKEWDANTGALETYQECLRVLKPGGHILAFSAARTYHHLAITLEQAGFEIRDQIMWIYSSGFPKSQDIGRSIQRKLGVKKTKRINATQSRNKEGLVAPDINGAGYEDHYDVVEVTDPKAKEWEGWGTALKPAHEPIALARKPTKLSFADNVQKWGTGALNIDATRIPLEDNAINVNTQVEYSDYSFGNAGEGNKQTNLPSKFNPNEAGRFPSNVLGEIPDYQKYFYCPKVSRRERHIGHTLDIDRGKMVEIMGGYWCDDNGTPGSNGKSVWLPHTGLIYAHGLTQVYADWCKNNNKESGNVGNNHPTVKPVALMEYLIKLVTPPGGTVLDPFNGSGSTGMAAVGLGYNYIGIELDPVYVKIAETRITAWKSKDLAKNVYGDLFTE